TITCSTTEVGSCAVSQTALSTIVDVGCSTAFSAISSIGFPVTSCVSSSKDSAATAASTGPSTFLSSSSAASTNDSSLDVGVAAMLLRCSTGSICVTAAVGKLNSGSTIQWPLK